jgi:CheY-specific phosphatase CheX
MVGAPRAGVEDAARLTNFIRETSRESLARFANVEQPQIEEIDSTIAVLGHWSALILISGTAVRVTFRVYFSTETAKKLASGAYKMSESLVNSDQAYDFMKEYCNLCAGRVKLLLLTNNLQVGISLPLVTRGFDQVFEEESKETFCTEDRWRLVISTGMAVMCSARIESKQPLSLPKALVNAVEGEMESL